MLSLKGKTAGHSKEKGSDITKEVQEWGRKGLQIVFTDNDQVDQNPR